MNTPTGFKERLGQELAALAEARDRDGAVAFEEQTRGPRRGGPFVARRARRTALSAAVAIAATVVVVSLPRPGGTQGGPQPVRTATVAHVLDAASARAAMRPDVPVPGPMQWQYVKSVGCTPACGIWGAWYRGDGTEEAFAETTRGHEELLVLKRSARSLGEINDNPIAATAAVAKLPTEPRDLLKQVDSDEFFTASGETLPTRSPVTRFGRLLNILECTPRIPPKVNAAIYQALKLIPGVRLAGPMRSAAGRTGTALELATPNDPTHTRTYLILDTRTYAYLGQATRWQAAAGQVTFAFAPITLAAVDHPGQVPGGPVPHLPITTITEPDLPRGHLPVVVVIDPRTGRILREER